MSTYVCVYVYTYTHIICICMYVHYIYIYIYKCIRPFCVYVDILVCMYAYIKYIHKYIYIYIHIRAHRANPLLTFALNSCAITGTQVLGRDVKKWPSGLVCGVQIRSGLLRLAAFKTGSSRVEQSDFLTEHLRHLTSHL